jgi:iron complex transport system substrate-binding protein
MRVLSLHPVTTEVAFALGAGNLLVGRTDGCDWPVAARNVPSIGLAGEVTAHKILIFEPDVVLLGPGQERIDAPGNCRRVCFSPRSIEELYGAITMLADSLGKHIEGDLVVHDLRTVLERVLQKTQRFHAARVYAEPRDRLLAEVVRVAGGEPYTGVDTIEAIKAFNPQVIICCSDDPKRLELLLRRDGWAQLQAVRHERTFLVETAILRPTPRIERGARRLAKILHGVDVNGPDR